MSSLSYVRSRLNALAEIATFDNRWQLLAESLVGTKALRVYRLGGVEAVADHRAGDHLGGIRAVLGSDEYRALMNQIPVESVRSVLDLGAHIGSFVLLLKTLGAPLDRVLCVEPDPRSRQSLGYNLEHNGIAADIFEGAVSDNPGTVALHKGLLSTGSSLRSDCPNLGSDTIAVRAATFDTLTNQYFPQAVIDLCKMDVEGAEFDILLGQHAVTLDRCRYLLCEVHNQLGSQASLTAGLWRRGFALLPANGTRHPETILFRNEKFGQTGALPSRN
jgi:FkbM family methyltransferase